MAEIKKKIWPEYFEEILNGNKTFEFRLADWSCKPDDTLILEEWNPKIKKYTGRNITKKVGYVLKTKELNDFWPKEDIEKYGFQIISLKDK